MDIVDKATRSRIMAAVRSKGNRSTEGALRARLARAGLRGWRVCPDDVEGKPDFVFHRGRLAVFVDGCQWHGCPRCYRPPRSNVAYWSAKVRGNRARDKSVTRSLRRARWKVLRVWEHELKHSPKRVIAKIKRKLGMDV
jgi:DNA mismatch endonuclease (patch repair protein)